MVYFAFSFHHMLTYSCIFVVMELHFMFALLDCVHYDEDFMKSRFTIIYWGSVPYILLLFWPGWRKLFVVPRTLLYRGSLNQSSTVTRLLIGGLNCTVLYCTFQLLTRDMDLHGWLGAVKQPNKFDNIQPQNDHSMGIWSVQSSCPATGRLNIVKIK